jgi:hypothetical protein
MLAHGSVSDKPNIIRGTSDYCEIEVQEDDWRLVETYSQTDRSLCGSVKLFYKGEIAIFGSYAGSGYPEEYRGFINDALITAYEDQDHFGIRGKRNYPEGVELVDSKVYYSNRAVNDERFYLEHFRHRSPCRDGFGEEALMEVRDHGGPTPIGHLVYFYRMFEREIKD